MGVVREVVGYSLGKGEGDKTKIEMFILPRTITDVDASVPLVCYSEI